MRPPFIDVAKRALREHYPDALGGFVAGSITRGEGTPTSDIDLIVIHDDTFENPHRKSLIVDDWPVEFLVQNPKSVRHFLDWDISRGTGTLAHMMAAGIPIPESNEVLLDYKKVAQKIVDAGPSALDKKELDDRRYMLTDALDDLADATETAERNIILALLQTQSADFFLRANGQWSGTGKLLAKRFRAFAPDLFRQWATAFEVAFAGKDASGVSKVIDAILAPVGGRLWAGYESTPPSDWRG